MAVVQYQYLELDFMAITNEPCGILCGGKS
jgi:hypothetical protein